MPRDYPPVMEYTIIIKPQRGDGRDYYGFRASGFKSSAELEDCWKRQDANYETLEKQKAEEQAELDKEKRLQQAIIGIKNRMGKNAILKGTNFVEGATGKERNEQIGGHRK